MPRSVVFWTTSTIKDEKSAAKFHYIKTVSGKVVAQSIAFQVVSICWQGVAPFPWYLNAMDRPALEAPALHALRLIARQPWRHCVTSLRSAHWLPVAWNWRRAILSADAGLLVFSLIVSWTWWHSKISYTAQRQTDLSLKMDGVVQRPNLIAIYRACL